MMAEKPPLTSVIMVTYHTGDVLFDALSAVLAQTAPVELCLVDNGNPPEVVDRLKAMAAADPRLHFITGHGNVGFSCGCNRGARAARGEYLLFLNPDSLLPLWSLETLHQVHARLPAPAMLGARLLDEEGRDQRGCRRALLTPATAFIEALHLGRLFPNARLNFNKDPVPTSVTAIPAISGAFMFLARGDFWKIEGFDESYFLHVEDLDLCFRFRKAGGEIYFVPEVIVTHIGGTSDATSSFIEKHKARGFIRYFHSHFGSQYPWVFLWCLDLAVWARTALKIGLSPVRQALRSPSSK